LDILEETGMLNAKLVDTPMDPSVILVSWVWEKQMVSWFWLCPVGCCICSEHSKSISKLS